MVGSATIAASTADHTGARWRVVPSTGWGLAFMSARTTRRLPTTTTSTRRRRKTSRNRNKTFSLYFPQIHTSCQPSTTRMVKLRSNKVTRELPPPNRRCKHGGCTMQRWYGSARYCMMHACCADGCSRKTLYNKATKKWSNYCAPCCARLHCSTRGCQNVVGTNGGQYCGYHACSTIDCTRQRWSPVTGKCFAHDRKLSQEIFMNSSSGV